MTVAAGVVTTGYAGLWPRSARLDVYQGIGPGADARVIVPTSAG